MIREVFLFADWALEEGWLDNYSLGQHNHRLKDIEKAPLPERL